MDEKPSGHLATHLLVFGYLLHEMGVPVSPGQMLAALEALEHVPITNREDFRSALRCMLVPRRQLRHRDIDDAIDTVSRHVLDWSGGTRIGDAIKEFNFRWGHRVLGRGPVVLLISDGRDRGDPTVLRRELDRLQRSCHRLIWLNPLLGSPGYEPLTVGMQAALSFVDAFLPVHNLVSLEQLGAKLSTISAQPTARRQRPVLAVQPE